MWMFIYATDSLASLLVIENAEQCIWTLSVNGLEVL